MTAASHMTAVEDRVLPLRARGDLEIQESWFQQQCSWIVKDPLALKYHRLGQAEITVLQSLNGQVTLRDIRDKLQQQFPTKSVRLMDLQHLIGSLFRSGLLLSHAPGQAQQLLGRKRETNRREWVGRLNNVLAIRFPGVDPEPLLARLHPWIGWIFSKLGIVIWCVVVASATSLMLANFDEFRRRLPALNEFFSVGNLAWLVAVMASTKILHELGHGLSCKYFGGECHEIGAMLLVFTPAMYCDTSDSWLLPNKWHRAFIGAAGMYVEVFLAALAVFGWWYTRPGTLNFVFLNVIFVSSVSTVLFNANPLLRYDGYYILSDLLEIPNLAQKSRLALMNGLRVHCLGLDPINPRRLPQRKRLAFATYSVASFAYRWFVLAMIVWFISKVFEPYGLQVIGQLVIAISAVGMLGVPLWQLGKFFAVPGRFQQVKPYRLVATAVGLLLMTMGIFLIPLPKRVMTSVIVRPDRAEQIYVSVPGSVTGVFVQPGQAVVAGQQLAALTNTDAQLRLRMAEGEQAQQQLYLQNLQRMQTTDPTVSAEIPTAQAALEDVKRQLAELQLDQQRLQLMAGRDGIIIPPPEVPRHDLEGLTTFSGTAFDSSNRGVYLETGTLFCTIGDPNEMMATLVFEQSQLQLIRPGQTVDILLDEYPTHPIRGTIREISKIDLRQPPRELTAAAGGPLDTITDPQTGEQRLLFVMYEASVPIHDLDLELLNGFRGRAKVYASAETVAKRVARFARNTLHFR